MRRHPREGVPTALLRSRGPAAAPQIETPDPRVVRLVGGVGERWRAAQDQAGRLRLPAHQWAAAGGAARHLPLGSRPPLDIAGAPLLAGAPPPRARGTSCDA